MHLESIHIEGECPPLNDIKFEFNSEVNVFTGPNGTGKTTALRCISTQMSIKVLEWLDSRGGIRRIVSRDWPNLGGTARGVDMNACPWVYIPATRMSMPVDNSAAAYTSNNEARRSMTDLLLDDMYQFDGMAAYHAIQLLFAQGKSIQAAQVTWQAFKCSASIAKEIIDGERGPRTYRGAPTTGTIAENWHQLDDQERLTLIALANPTVVHPAMGIPTYDNSDMLFVGSLSAGTQGIFAWVLYMALKMASFKDFEEGWERSSAILLIDEIENHLHPTWQRRVIPSLRKHFPGLQVFATTHSPFVVAGLTAGQVHLLAREGEGTVTVSTNTENVMGWTADEILRTMMGVDDPTDDATAAAVSELRQLRNEPPRASPEEEEQRQQRIQDLRRKVDRDLLAGGPEAAQRELFEQQFEEALQKIRQSQSPNQENG